LVALLCVVCLLSLLRQIGGGSWAGSSTPETARACPAANHLAACRPAHPELADLRPIYPAANKSSRRADSAIRICWLAHVAHAA